jgi:hypothetical protein
MKRPDHITREEMLAKQRKPVSRATGSEFNKSGTVIRFFDLRKIARMREIQEEMKRAKEEEKAKGMA